MKPLYSLTIEEASAGLKKGDYTSLELTQACLDRIKAVDPKINAFIRVDVELAIAQAKASDERRKLGFARGLLEGIPYNLKDVYATKDSPTTAASHMLENWWAPYNATVYHKLKEAGAVLLGKTNTDEFTMGSSTESSYYGVTKNPWDLTRVSGGSSGGPAASIAAQMGLFSVGTDTGGSIRQPAGFCGVTGLRPTYGRISRYGELAMASSLDQTGVITKTARDAGLVLAVLAGPDGLDATSSPEKVPEYLTKKSIKGLKIGLPKEYFGDGVNKEVVKRVKEAVGELERLGAIVKEVSLPLTDSALAVYYIICPAEVSSNMARYDGIHFGHSIERRKTIRKGELVEPEMGEVEENIPSLYDVYAKSRAQGLGSEVKRRVMLGAHVLSSGYYDAYYKRAEAVRLQVARQYEEVFKEVDVLAAPTSPNIAFKIGDKTGDPLAMYMEDVLTVPLNIAGIPGLSIPCGLVEGMPVGLQLMAGRFQEATLLNVAHCYQLVSEYHKEIVKLLNG